MFRTKRDVDRHVSHILNRIREEKERNSRGYQFAKLYYDVRDYESCKRYLQAFFSVREVVPQAHKLMGQACEALGDKQTAIEAYKRSLDIDPDQNDLILKVCELYSDRNVAVNAENAKFWIEKAEKQFPNNTSVFKLKERVIDQDSDGDTVELEHLISTELVNNPTDVQLHIKLLRLYIKSNEADRAYTHAVNTEKTMAFVHSMSWYECLADVYRVYQDQRASAEDTTLHTQKLFALASLVHLQLQAEDRDILSVVRTLHRFDTGLQEASELRKQSAEWTSFLTEMKGQLFYLIGVVLMKRASKSQVSWTDACMYSGMCFLLSESAQPINQRSSWFCQLPPDRKKFYTHLYQIGCDRLSQGGHMLYSLMNKEDSDTWCRRLRQSVCTAQSKDNIYSVLFTSDEMRRHRDSSFLVQSDMLTTAKVDVPSKDHLLQYDSVAYSLHSGNLHNLVWLCLQYHSLRDDIQPDYEQKFNCQLYPNMKFSVVDLSGGDPGSLCQLDIQVYLYLCVRWMAIQQQERRRNLHVIPHKPDLLPACLSTHLCTSQQAAWWSAVYKMESKTSREKLSSVWGVVLRGLETLRLVSPHVLPVQLVVHIAKTLDARAKEMEVLDGDGLATRKLLSTQTRAGFYWRAANMMLDRTERNVRIKQPKESLFPGETSVDPAVGKQIQEQVKFSMAMVAMREEEHEEALLGFESLCLPEASFYTGLIYKRLSENVESSTANGSGLSHDQSNQEMVLLSKAKTSLYQTLDRLETNPDEELSEAARRELEDVVCRLISLESGGALVDSALSNQNYSTAESEVETEEEPSKLRTHKTPVLPSPIHRGDMMRPSPTRIEVQLKALETANSAVSSRLTTLEETIRTQEKLVQELFTQLRESRDENKAMRDHLQLLSFQGLSNMSLPRPPIPQSYPGTPQRAMFNAMNSTYGSNVPYDYQAATGLPPHMSQFGYQQQGSSPRHSSAYGQPTYEEEYNNVDGEFYDPDVDGDYNVSDQNLIPDWPFGQKAGMEGKSTITYSPHTQPRGISPANAGAFVNALRGQAIQYSGYQQQGGIQQQAPQMPGPGFFSQNNQQNIQPSLQTQPGLLTPGQGHMSGPVRATGSPAITSLLQQKSAIPAQTNTTKSTSIMPPNAIASPSTEAKPKLIPGSVGVPTPKKDEKPQQPPVPQSGLLSTPGATPAVPSPSETVATAKQTEKQTTLASTQDTPQKTSFKGFSFTSTPKISEPKSDDKAKENASKAATVATTKPFSGFSFTTPKSTTSSVPAVTQSTFGQSAASLPTFGSLAVSASSATAFQAGGDSKAFVGTGQPLFGKSPPPPRRRNPSVCSDEHIEEYEPNVDFKPVVPLPDLVEVKTGEEDEEKFFGERAKLFRFDLESNQWKERGIGEMKILKHKETQKARIVMRREQVLKLCANHVIMKEMKLTPLSSSDRAWVWTAMDYAEEEMKQEKFAVKFKTQDLAEKFKEVFTKCQDAIDNETKEKFASKDENDEKAVNEASVKMNNLKSSVQLEDPKSTATGESDNDTSKVSLTELFKAKEGSWTCEGCFVRNDGNILKCPCCNQLKPGVKPEDVKPTQAPAFGSGGGFKFGTQPSGTSSGDGTAGGFKFGSSSSTTGSSSGSGFKFGSQPSSNTSTESSATVTTLGASAGTGFKFGSPSVTDSSKPSSGFTFGTPATTSGSTGFKFAASMTSSNETDCGPKQSTGFLFATPTASSALATSGSVFGSKPVTTEATKVTSTPATSSFVFGSKPTTTEATKVTTTPATSGFVFGSKSATAEALKTSSTTGTSGFAFGVKPASTDAQKASSSTGASGFVFDLKPVTTEATQASADSSGTGLNLPAPCKPSSGFTFGDATKAAADSSGQSSAGFNVNKETSQYVFGNIQSSTTEDTSNTAKADSTTKSKDSGDVSSSLLAKFLLTPDSWKCGKCSTSIDGELDTCAKCGVRREDSSKATSMKPPGPNASPVASSVNTGGTAAPSGLFGSSSPAVSAAGTVKDFSFGKGTTEKKPESFVFGTPEKAAHQGFKFSLNPVTDSEKQQEKQGQPATIGSGFQFTFKPSSTPVKSPVKSTAITSPKSPEVTEDGFYLNKEGDDAHIHFEPVIALPDKVEVKTGEEDEELLFCHRAKLYRFANGEWKERGLGDVKVLYNSGEQKARILMRREQILKLCCNHYITSALEFQVMPNSKDCALVWHVMDFADEEPKNEKFSIRFKTADIANRFKTAVEDAKVRIGAGVAKEEASLVDTSRKEVKSTAGSTPEVMVPPTSNDSEDVVFVKEESATAEQIAKARQFQLPDHFYLYEASPPCPGCRGCRDEMPVEEAGDADAEEYGDDEGEDDDEYEDIDTEDEDEEYDEEESDDQGDGAGLVKAPTSSGAYYISQLLSSDQDEVKETTDQVKEGDNSAKEKQKLDKEPAESDELIFGSRGAPAFSFSSLAASKESFKTDENKPFTWQGQGKQLFGGSSAGGAEGDRGSDDEGGVAQGDDPHFEPIVPLPDLVEIKTGEEDETPQFSHRAKVFRFDKETNQWKERGIGEMKILKHKTTGACRLLLRREQVHKLACNCRLDQHLSLQPMNTSETSWCWTAQDYSDTEPRIEQFAVKFKTIELAKSFKDKVEELQAELRTNSKDD